MQNFKWGVESFNDSPINVVFFIARNKDNKEVEGFKERRMSFITHAKSDSDYLKEKFEDFVNRGVNGETSRMYYSINERDGKNIYKDLLHFLFDNPDFNLCSIQPKLAGIAAKKENSKTKHWMFDFDLDDNDKLHEFTDDIHNIDSDVELYIYKTPHGFAVVSSRGFDTRTLMEKWKECVTLKRDDLLCVKWQTKGE